MKRLLVIEDDPFQTRLIQAALKKLLPDGEIVWKTRAEDINPAEAKGYDLILSDVILEGNTTGGLKLWEKFHQLHLPVPLVLMSAMPLPEFYREASHLSAPTPFLLKKPFYLWELQEVLENIRNAS